MDRRAVVTASLPPEGFVRLKAIVGDRKANPPIPGILPIGQSTWLEGVAKGKFPKGIS
jgi:hypothetical protein